MPVMESRAAGAIAFFAMFAVGAFTSEIPFAGQKSTAVVIHVS